MGSCAAGVAVLALAAAVAAPTAAAQQLVHVGDFASPIFVTAPPGDASSLFVVERGGTIRIVRGGRALDPPFLEQTVSTVGERGLLSMAFAPDYGASGRLYVFYTDAGGDVRVDELLRSADPDRADPATRRNLLLQEHSSASNHNGGQLQFGPDGLLYASIGDGASGPNAQDPGNFLGKLARIDPASAAKEVYALGLRNPYRFSFDRATGDLIVADVGQSAQEEVDFLPAGTAPGANFGWPACEGTSCAGPPPPGYVPPVLTYANDASTCAITGGYVVRDPALGALAGRYLYGDFCAGALRSAALAASGSTGDGPVGLSVPMLASFGEDAAGCVYAVSLEGPVYRVAPPGDPSPGPCPLPSPPGGPGPPGDPGTPSAGTADTRPPRLLVRHRRAQRLGRRRALVLALRCDEPCRVTLSGRASWRRAGATAAGPRPARRAGTAPPALAAAVRLTTLRRTLPAARRTRVLVRVSPRRARSIRRALRRSRSARARLVIVARDAAGNRALARRTIRLRR